MATKKISNLLPTIFRTDANEKFLSATLDQLVSEPSLTKLNGFIGRKFAPTHKPSDSYISEYSMERSNYQLEPSVVVRENNNVVFFTDYVDFLNKIRYYGGSVVNQDRLFDSEYYSYDPHISLDELVNYSQYYWLPNGPDAVDVFSGGVDTEQEFIVSRDATNNKYIFTPGIVNNSLTLARGGLYTFVVDQPGHNFWIQTEPGVDGVLNSAPAISSRDIFGVTNNGEDSGTITFRVPNANAQNRFTLMSRVYNVDFTTSLSYSRIQNQLLSQVLKNPKFWDGLNVNQLNGKTFIFIDQDKLERTPEIVTDDDFWTVKGPYDTTSWDEGGWGFVAEGWDFADYEVGEVVPVNERTSVWTIKLVPASNLLTFNEPVTVKAGDTVIQPISGAAATVIEDATDATTIKVRYENQRLFEVIDPLESVPTSGGDPRLIRINNVTQYFYETVNEVQEFQGVYPVPNSNNDYIIRIDNRDLTTNTTRIVNRDEKVFVRSGTYNSGREFYRNTDDLFRTVPLISSIQDTLYFQDGTTGQIYGEIKLVDPNNNVLNVETDILGKKYYTSPNGVEFTNGLKIKFDSLVTPAAYQNNTYYISGVGKSIRLVREEYLVTPEFYNDENSLNYPERKIFLSSPTIGVIPVGTTIKIGNTDVLLDEEALSGINYVITLSDVSSIIEGQTVTGTNIPNGTTVAEIVPLTVFPEYITIDRGSQDLNSWSRNNRWFHKNVIEKTAEYNKSVAVYDQASRAQRPIVQFHSDLQLFNYGRIGKQPVDIIDETITDAFNQVQNKPDTNAFGVTIQNGMRIVFSKDRDPLVRNKIFILNLIEPFIDDLGNSYSAPQIHLSEAKDGDVEVRDTIIVTNGLNKGTQWWYNGDIWIKSQQKTSPIQAPLFDIFDKNGTSISERTRSSFTGSKLFGYKIGNGIADPILGFTISYKALATQGDIEFANYFETDLYTYVENNDIIEEKISYNFIHEFNGRNSATPKNNWQTVVIPSHQKQWLRYYFDSNSTPTILDISPGDATISPTLTVYQNNIELLVDQYVFDPVTREFEITSGVEFGDKIDIEIYSRETSSYGFYEVPKNLNYNAQNISVESLTLGQIRNHTVELIRNSIEIQQTSSAKDRLRDFSITQYSGSILQHSSPLPYGMLFLTDEQVNFVKSVRYSQHEYSKFKHKFLELSANLPGVDPNDPVTSVDLILESINAIKNKTFPWYYSDMVPYGKLKSTIEYTVFDPFVRTYEISSVFEDTKLSNRAVIVYLNGTQLIKDKDFSFNKTLPAITFADSTELSIDDIIIIDDYENTDGCYIPETPSKLGLYPKFTPEIFEDDTYRTAINVIRGHDGSITPTFNDYRDNFLLELEKRIFNNIKLPNTGHYEEIYTVNPNKFRDSDYTWQEANQLLSRGFLTWVGNNRLNFSENNTFKSNDAFTWNYGGFIDRIDGSPMPGSWRACYLFYYGTVRPHTHPWEMLGFTIKPDWWEENYGPAPYTGTNKVLWDDLEAGYIRGGDTPGVDLAYAKPGLSKIIPVDQHGFLISPAACIAQTFNTKAAASSWQIGQLSPIEYAWRVSSDFPYAVQLALALAKPAKYFGTMLDVSRYNNINSLSQYLNENNTHLNQVNVSLNGNIVNGETTRAAGYLNWMADYLTSMGISPSKKILSLINNYEVNLAYRIAGFTDQKILTVLAEQNSPDSSGSGVVIPNENYKVHLYKTAPMQKITYSAVIVEKSANGFTVRGYDLNNPYFIIIPSITNSNATKIKVLNRSVAIFKDYQNVKLTVPYGYEFKTQQQVADFLISYERYLMSQGFTFNEFVEDLAESRNWKLSVKEFLYWEQQGWKNGSVLVLSPVGNTISAITNNVVIDEVVGTQYGSRLIDLNFNIINKNNYNVSRTPSSFKLNINDETVIGFAEFNHVQFEHVLLFDNKTVFNDVIYQPESGNRQFRLKLVGQKTSDWDGSLHAPGFIFNDGKIDEWQKGKDYLKGELVSHKNQNYVALQNIIAGDEFQFEHWTLLEEGEIKTGLLSNFSTNAIKAKTYYNSYADLNDFGEMQKSHGLIGFRPRQYLSDLGISETSQVEFYKGYIKQKGTFNAISELTTAEFNNLKSSIDLHEEWAVRVGEYGALDVNPYVEITLDEKTFSVNPAHAEFVGVEETNRGNGLNVFNKLQLYKSTDLYDGKIALSRDENSNYDNDIPTAGFVNIDEVSATIFDITDYRTLNTKIKEIGSGYTIWCAKDFTQKWNVYRVTETGVNVVSVTNSLDNYISLAFNNFHRMKVNDIFMVRNFDASIDGFYQVYQVVDVETVMVKFNGIVEELTTMTGNGMLFKLDSLRFKYMENAREYVPPYGWKPGERIWIETDAETSIAQGQPFNSGNNLWKVYEKTMPWESTQGLTKLAAEYTSKDNYGQSVKLSYDSLITAVGSPAINLIEMTLSGGISAPLDDEVESFLSQPATGALAKVLRPAVNSTQVIVKYEEDSPAFNLLGTITIRTRFIANSATTTSSTNVMPTLVKDKTGEVNIFVRDYRDQFVQTSSIIPAVPNTKTFGYSVDMSDTKLFVGAPTSNNEGYVFVYEKPEGTVGYNVSQIINGNVAGVDFGASITVDKTGDWLYVGAPNADKVYVYGINSNVSLITYTANVAGGITSTGNVVLNFKPYSEESLLITTPTRTYIPGKDFKQFGTSTLLQFTEPFTSNVELTVQQKPYYTLVDTIQGPAGSLFGSSLDVSWDGVMLAVGAPNNDVTISGDLREQAGVVRIYDRRIQAFNAVTDSSDGGATFVTTGNIGLVHKVWVDGVEIDRNDFTVSSNSVTFLQEPVVGSVIRIETNQMDLVDTIISIDNLDGGYDSIQSGAKFGSSLTVCSNGCAVYIGAPYYNKDTVYNTGAVWKFHNRGRLYGTNTGFAVDPTFTVNDSFRIDEYEIKVGLGLDEIIVANVGDIITQVISGANVTVTESTVSSYIKVSNYTNSNVFSINEAVTINGNLTSIYPRRVTLDELVETINEKNILGVSAVNEGGKLRVDSNKTINKDLMRISTGQIQSGSLGILEDARLSVNAFMQIIVNPYNTPGEFFGSKVILAPNAYMLLISSDRGTTKGYTTFDNLDTVFDSRTTEFFSTISGSGSAYIYELYDDPRNEVEHPGRYAFAQQLNPGDLAKGDSFGTAIDIIGDYVVVSAPNDDTQLTDAGSVYIFKNIQRTRGWNLLRYQEPKVDIESINRIFIYNKVTNTILNNLEFIDPIKGKILGLAEQEITYKTEYDPATYNRGTNSLEETINAEYYWNGTQVGQVWWDLSKTRFIDYEQSDITYRNVNWGRLFPGSEVTICEWIESTVPPSRYVENGGDGVPRYENNSPYVEIPFVDPLTNTITSKYYFWVKDKGSVKINDPRRRFPVSAIKSMIENPKSQGLPYAAIIKNNTVLLYNIGKYLSDSDVVLHIDYENVKNSSIIHSEYELIQQSNPTAVLPDKIVNKFIDSLAGIDASGLTVPDPTLSVADRYGISYRPRQGVFINKDEALKTFMSFVNDILIQQPIAKTKNLDKLNTAEQKPKLSLGEVDLVVATDIELEYLDKHLLSHGQLVLVEENTSEDGLWTVHKLGDDDEWFITKVQSHKTNLYWDYVDWYAPGYDKTIKSTYRVETVVDALKIAVSPGDIIRIDNSGNGEWQLIVVNDLGAFVTVGIQNGTVQLKGLIPTSVDSELGFGTVGYAEGRYDQNPNVEIRSIVQALKDDIFIGDLEGQFNNLFFTLINYIFTEQPYVDWIFKTSFINVFHKLRELDQYPTYTKDNQDYYQEYISEVKPYSAKIREYLIGYNSNDTFSGDITDFDLPAYYDTDMKMFRSPSGEGNSNQQAKDQQLWSTGYIDERLVNVGYIQWYDNYEMVIDRIVVEYAGSGYAQTPTVVIFGGGEVTSPATAIATINYDTGEVISIEVTDSGSGFSSTPVVEIRGNSTTPARAYAILRNNKVRSFDTTLKFDRIAFLSQVKAWKPNTEYSANDLVRYNNVGYRVLQNINSGDRFEVDYYAEYNSADYTSAADRILGYYNPTDKMPVVETFERPLIVTETSIDSNIVYVDTVRDIKKGMYISSGNTNSAVITDAVSNMVLLSGYIEVNEGDVIDQFNTEVSGIVAVKNRWTNLIKLQPMDSEFDFGAGNIRIYVDSVAVDTNVYPVARVNYIQLDKSITTVSGSELIATYDNLGQLMSGVDYPGVTVLGLDYNQQPGFDATSERPYSPPHGIQTLSQADRDEYYTSVTLTSNNDEEGLLINFLANLNVVGQVVASESFKPDGVSNTFTLGNAATTTSVVVSLNNFVLTPTVDYSVSGSTLTLVSTPLITDEVEVTVLTTNVDDFVVPELTKVAITNIESTGNLLPGYSVTYSSDYLSIGTVTTPITGVLSMNTIRINVANNVKDAVEIEAYNTISGEVANLIAAGTLVANSTVLLSGNVSMAEYTKYAGGSIPQNLWYNPVDDQMYKYNGDYPYNSLGWFPVSYSDSGMPFDSSVYDNIAYDSDGIPILSDDAIDSIIQSNYTDLNLGLRVEDIVVDGDKYLSPITSHAPEELVPGIMFDTLDIQVYTKLSSETEVLGYRIFNNLLRETTYLRIADNYMTLLSANLSITDTEISVVDASKLPVPNPFNAIPGVIFVGTERITYYTRDLVNNKLGQIRRSTEGTGAPLVHLAGTPVVDGGLDQKVIDSNNVKIDVDSGQEYTTSSALSYYMRVSNEIPAQVGDYLSQTSTGANVMVVGADFISNASVVLVNKISTVEFAWVEYFVQLSSTVSVAVGDIIEQESTGARLQVVADNVSTNEIIAVYKTVNTLEFGQGNITINDVATDIYPIAETIDFETTDDTIYINGTIAETMSFPVAIEQAGLLTSLGSSTIQGNISLTTSQIWYNSGIEGNPADGTGLEGAITPQALFLKEQMMYGNIGLRLEQWYDLVSPVLNTLTAVITEDGELIIEE